MVTCISQSKKIPFVTSSSISPSCCITEPNYLNIFFCYSTWSTNHSLTHFCSHYCQEERFRQKVKDQCKQSDNERYVKKVLGPISVLGANFVKMKQLNILKENGCSCVKYINQDRPQPLVFVGTVSYNRCNRLSGFRSL